MPAIKDSAKIAKLVNQTVKELVSIFETRNYPEFINTFRFEKWLEYRLPFVRKNIEYLDLSSQALVFDSKSLALDSLIILWERMCEVHSIENRLELVIQWGQELGIMPWAEATREIVKSKHKWLLGEAMIMLACWRMTREEGKEHAEKRSNQKADKLRREREKESLTRSMEKLNERLAFVRGKIQQYRSEEYEIMEQMNQIEEKLMNE